jgi:hypothetical protein
MARKAIASNQTRGFRLVNTYAITADNQQVTVDLPRGPHMEACLVRISGSINVGTLFAGGVRALAPYYMLRRADWVLNSNVTMDSVSGPQLYQTYITRRNYPASTAPSAAAGATTFDATFIFDRVLMDMMRPKDSMLKTDVGISNNQLRLQLGALSDMYGVGAGAATYTSVSMSVHVIDYQESRDSNGNTPAPLYYVKRNGILVGLTASGAGQQIKLNTGNRLRAVSIRVLNATTREPDTTILTRLRIQRAGDTRCDVLSNELVRLNQLAYGVSLASAQYVVDFANTGQLGVRYSEFWPIPSSADTFMLVDTSAASIIEMATIEGVDLA